MKFSCEIFVSLFGTSADPARKCSGERLNLTVQPQAYEQDVYRNLCAPVNISTSDFYTSVMLSAGYLRE